jgi:aminopeptidase-like protein
VLWVFNFSDGDHTLLDTADRAGLPFAAVRAAADALLEVDLLADAPA